MSILIAPAHRVTLALFIASLVLAGVVAGRDPRAPELAVAALLWGAIACAASLAVAARARPGAASPVLRAFQSGRGTIVAEIQRLRRDPAVQRNAELVQVLTDALTILDDEIAPALRQLADSETDFRHHLALYAAGRLPRPHPDALERLESNRARQRDGMESAVQRIAGAEATFFALIHRVHDPGVVAQAREWLGELRAIHADLGDVLRGPADEPEPILRLAAASPPSAKSVPAPGLLRPGATSVPAPGLLTPDEAADQAKKQLTKLVEEALRQLNKPGSLASSELTTRVPRTLAATRKQWSQGSLLEPTPLEQAQALGEVLNAAIDRLKPARADDQAPAALQYEVLHLEYRLGMETKHVADRLHIGDATFFRYRRAAIQAVAEDLRSREEALAAVSADATAD
jgi:hypothetical protein